MGTEVMSTIKLCDTDGHADEVLCTQYLHSLMDRKQMPFYSLHVLPGYAILMNNDLARSRSRRRCPTLAIRSNLETMHNTPPKVDISQYRNRKVKAVGKRRWRLITLLAAPHRLFHSSPSKKTISCSSQVLVTGYDKADDTLAVTTPIYHVLAEYPFCRSKNLLSESLPFMILKTCECSDSSRYPYFGLEDVQMYFPPVVIQKSNDDRRRATHRIILEIQDRPISEGDQKKDGNRPEPAKPTKPKPGKQKPEREGDKGKRKGKGPRTEGSVPLVTLRMV